MQTVIIVIHLFVVIALVGVVLLQRSEGGGLGMGGGGVSGFMTGRGQTNALTRTTAILATIFFLTSLGLSVMASMQRGQRSIFDSMPGGRAPTAVPGAPGAPGAGGGVLDQLRQMQGDQPAAPSAPAPAPQPAAPPAPTTPQVPGSQ
ncbi:MAG: preprotein translocase subunit SecG [Chelatococcus sp.]|jgi:preprotein translocase subunit SecG|uniref:preprotein translocase subunit SecG n=1 Tax=Chelatococcus sp. TaxID=1953771 RepID=UPI0025C68E9B|nr:preprotein translocase subunit SecG [Chelatococcus sp.]MBX3538754.1 preprotein translocase subunit SecG [Chelatococcus sp.]